jgi:Flp pilus assembly protein TadG
MWWLMRRVRGGAAERGAVAALVAILVSTGVLVGMGAIVVDAGQIYSARAQMQNAADAAALKIAQACASTIRGTACTTNPADPTTAAYAAANPYAANNAMDGKAHISAVCGSGAAALSTTCPSDKTTLYCPTTPTGNFVEVHTQTGSSAANTLLPPAFGKALLGGSYNGKTVGACSQASWGPVGTADGLAVTESLCTWKLATDNGTRFGPNPPYSVWPPPSVVGYLPSPPSSAAVVAGQGREVVLGTHGDTTDPRCAGSVTSGWQLPGGFGFLPDTSTTSPQTCSTTVSADGTYQDRTGAPVKDECITALAAAWSSHAITWMPIFKGVTGTGGNGTYLLAGFAAFIITGGNINGQHGGFRQPSNITGSDYCSGSSDKCIYGFFTQSLIPAGAIPGGSNNDFGLDVVSLTG